MTFKEKLEQLAELIENKSKIVQKMDDDFVEDGVFKIYSAEQYKKAYNEHTNAVNIYGSLVSRMAKDNLLSDNEYYD